MSLLKKRLRRFPKIYDNDLLYEVAMHTFIAVHKTFLEKRPLKDLARLVYTHDHFRQKMRKKTADAQLRHLMIKLFHSHVEGTRVLGIALGVELFNPHELLQEKHIYRALVSLLPGIEVIPDSFYSCLERSGSFLFCYLEIKKLRGANLSFKDIDLLRKRLPFELKQSIQSLTFSLVFSYNEEEIYKNAIRLADEVNTENDIPQVIIFFQGQVQEILRFSVVVARARKKNDPPFLSQAHMLPSSSRLSLERVIPLGTFEKGGVKEAIIFSLEINCSLFLRKNWSIDLNQGRNYVAKIVEQLFGPFRDYNGGLLSQQNKQIEQIKKRLRGKYENFYPLMQELFHSFNPPSFQALISTLTAKRLFSFCVAFLKKKIPPTGFLMEKKSDGKTLFILVKTSSSEYLEILIEELKKVLKQIHSSVGYSSFECEREHYLCFVDLNNALQLELIAHLESALNSKNTLPSKDQKHLRLNFQEGDPPSLNPQIAIDQRCRCLGKALFEGLTRLDLSGIPQPAAAKEIRLSPCQTIYTFILRKHYWSNGEEVSAYDFEQTWKQAISPDSHCLRSDLFYIIKNARAAHQGQKSLDEVKVKALNAKTLVVELEYPAFYFLHLIAHPIFSPIYKGEQEPYHFNGPFLLKDWKRDHSLHLTSNPYYWDKVNVQLKDVSISMLKEMSSIGKLFDTGEIDWIGEPFSTSLPEAWPLQRKQNWHKKRVDQFYWIYLNTRSLPLSSANIRKALACAIHRKALMKNFKGKPCYFKSTLTSLENTSSKWDGNAELAKAFFIQGLKDLKMTHETFPTITLYWSAVGEKPLVELIKEQIASTLNISIELKGMPWNHLSYLLDKREYQLATCYRSSPYLYPRSYLELFRESSNLYNSSQWDNPKYRDLIDQALQSFQNEKREKFLIEAEQILLDEMPVIPVFFPDYHYLLASKIKRVAIAANGDVDLKWTLMKKGS